MINISNKKNILLSLVILIFVSSSIFAGCGSCELKDKAPIPKKSSSFIITVPETGDLEGFVIASCGMCNFGYKKNRGCSLTIKIGDTVYPAKGAKIHDHGDPHSKEGFCNAIRVAYVSGKIEKNKFYADSFTLIESPK